MYKVCLIATLQQHAKSGKLVPNMSFYFKRSETNKVEAKKCQDYKP